MSREITAIWSLSVRMRPTVRRTLVVAAALLIMQTIIRKNRVKTSKRRRYWTKRMYKTRRDHVKKLFKDLIFDGSVKNFTRMSVEEFEHLCLLLKDKIIKKDTSFRRAISVQERVLITLRYLSTGDSFTSLQYMFRASKQVISNIIAECCNALIDVLKDYVKVRIDDYIMLII